MKEKEKKLLEELLKQIDLSPERVKIDSRNIAAGDVFIAIEGIDADGHAYINDAINRGAGAVVCRKIPADSALREGLKIAEVSDTKEALKFISEKLFSGLADDLKIYGVTGTNGKTTTSFLTYSVLKSAGADPGLISTVWNISKDDEVQKASMTTPGLFELRWLLARIAGGGKKAAVLEVSSHALSQKRTEGIMLDSAVFTNITPEHLDYHKTMDNYLKDKSKIFDHLKKGGVAVLNADDPLVAGSRDRIKSEKIITFGIKNKADVRASNIKMSISGSEFDVETGKFGNIKLKNKLIGHYNVYNTLAATASMLYTGIEKDVVVKGILEAMPVPGRLEKVRSADIPFDCVVDYAHTPDALENVLGCVRKVCKKRLICVFGCGGDRDRSKRPVMGRLATEMADFAIITSDNPRSEDPEEIVKQIKNGVLGKENYSIMIDRKDAIREALKMAGEGDIVLIAGKGHEDYQIIGEKVIPFDDKEVALELIKEIGY